MKLLIAAATEQEIAPFLAFLDKKFSKISGNWYCKGNVEVYICITGVGMMLSAFALSEAFNAFRPDFSLQAGIAGAYDRALSLTSMVLVRTEILGDLGAEDKDSFLDVFELGLVNAQEAPFHKGHLINPMNNFPLTLNFPKVKSLCVNTVSGNQATIDSRTAKYNCSIENMEGAAFHYICLKRTIPFMQIRAISNYVTVRDTSQWKTREAIASINDWMIENISLQS